MSLLFSFVINLRAQERTANDKLLAFVKNINIFNFLNLQEKVYLHFDNSAYFVGDSIWFKAYVVTATEMKPTDFSRVLYVELLSPEGVVLETKKLKIIDGQCHNGFSLLGTLRSGFYEVRAYTKVMLNYDQETLYSRVFPVYLKPEIDGDYSQRSMKEPFQLIKDLRDKQANLDKVHLTFYPEGGHLVQDITSRVAFTATDENGQSIDVSGTVLNEKNEEMTSFSTIHQGMGIFSICPDGSSYTINVHYKEKNHIFKLPETLSSGYVLTINNLQNDNLFLQLQRTSQMKGDTIGVSIMCRGKVLAFKVADMACLEEFVMKIPKAELPAGVHQITAFDRDGNILAQRMCFIRSQNLLQMERKQTKQKYTPFSKIYLDFNILNRQGQPVETTFSLSVRDAKSEVPTSYAGNVLSDLLLSSDIKGFIENVDYYFESNDHVHQQAMDVLMMTHGWTRYSWPLMTGLKPFNCVYKIEKGLVIEGNVQTGFLQNKRPKENVEVKIGLIFKDSLMQMGYCMTDKNGTFNYQFKDFDGKYELDLESLYQRKPLKSTILLNRLFSPPPKSYSFFDTYEPKVLNKDSLPGQTEVLIERKAINEDQIIKSVYVKAKKRSYNTDIEYDVEKEMNDLIDRGESYPSDPVQFLLQKPGFHQELPNTTLKYSERNIFWVGWYQDYEYDRFMKNRNAYILYRPLNQVTKILVSKNYERFSGSHWYRPNDGNTVLVMVFCQRDNALRALDNVRVLPFDGYSQEKVFFHPDYSRGVLPGDVDYRRTLYWNPDVKTDKDGNASISFYNNSSCKSVVVNAETITEQGIGVYP